MNTDPFKAGIEELDLLDKKFEALRTERLLLCNRIFSTALKAACDPAVPAVKRLTVLVSQWDILGTRVDIVLARMLARRWLADARAGRGTP